MSDMFDIIDFSKFDLSGLEAARNIQQNFIPEIPSAVVDIPSFEERMQPIIDRLEENNKQLQQTLGVQSMELIELKKHNETLKAELEQRKKSEKEAKLEAKRANIKANISIAVAIFAILADVIIAIVK